MHPHKRPNQSSLHQPSSQQSTLHTYFAPGSIDEARPTFSPLSSHPVKSSTSDNAHSLQASLFSVGMRIRKSVTEGYKRAPLSMTSGNDQCKSAYRIAATEWKPLEQDDTPFSSQESNVSTLSTCSGIGSAKRRRGDDDDNTRELDIDVDDEKENNSNIAAWASIFARPKAKAVSRRKRWIGAGDADLMDWSTDKDEFEDAGFLVP